MSDWSELDNAVDILSPNCDLTIMQCSSAYPCRYEQVGLNVLNEMRERYQCKVGFSDHTMGFSAPIAAATLGASVIEKHFTFSKHMYGSDAQHSMEPCDFTLLSNMLKEVSEMLEHPVDKSDITPYKEMKTVFQKSIVTSASLPKGTILESHHLCFKKPGIGIPASSYKSLLGKELLVDCEANQLLDLAWLS